MTVDINDLKRQANVNFAAMMELNDLVAKENRGFTDEELAKYSAMEADADRFNDIADREHKLLEAQKKIENVDFFRSAPGNTMSVITSKEESAALVERYSEAFSQFAVHGSLALQKPEFADLQLDTPIDGGALAPHTTFKNGLIKDVEKVVAMRRISQVLPVISTEELQAFCQKSNITGIAKGKEAGATVTKLTTPEFGTRSLHPHVRDGYALISSYMLKNLSGQTGINAEVFVRQMLAQAVADDEEPLFMEGTGANEPLGIYVASDNGISTDQDVTAAEAEAIGYDDIIDMEYALKTPYLKKAVWMVHRDFVKRVRKIKNGQNDYIWQPSQQAGEPQLLDGIPIETSESAPNTFETTKYVAVLGDFDWFWIVHKDAEYIQRLMELFALTKQVGFLMQYWMDGQPMKSEAFVRLQMA